MTGPGALVPAAAPHPPPPPAAVPPDAVVLSTRPSNLWRDTLGSILRQRSALVGLIILSVLVLTAIFASQIATHNPNETLLGVESGVQKREGPCIPLLGCPAPQPPH